jgi:membrane protein YdbS with pleckstrin-like domain
MLQLETTVIMNQVLLLLSGGIQNLRYTDATSCVLCIYACVYVAVCGAVCRLCTS